MAMINTALLEAKKQIENGVGLYFSDGNRKYTSTKTTYFLIFNLPCIVTCPGRCNGCENDCYAKKAENLYPDCLPCRYRNLLLSLRDDFEDMVVEYVERYATNKRTKMYKVLNNGGEIVFRIHESGDFYSKEYLKKWLRIAERLPYVTFLWYTKSFEFFEDLDISTMPSNFVKGGNFSVWEDMPSERKILAYKLAKKLGVRVYTALWETTKKAIKHGCKESLENTNRDYAKCTCKDCANCKICWKSKKLETIVAIH